MEKFNNWLALKLTAFVGSMWCAYLFCLIALVSLPATIATHNLMFIIAWLAQTFLQLVLLSVIMVGQNLKANESEVSMKKILILIEQQQTEELQELKDDKKLLKNELRILRRVK